ncbi:hypothetical protein [Prochlorococcus marinus]|nr:hypothetical protein PMIT1323_00715 [Prochlorococcus marinus str. MIT 1323]
MLKLSHYAWLAGHVLVFASWQIYLWIDDKIILWANKPQAKYSLYLNAKSQLSDENAIAASFHD